MTKNNLSSNSGTDIDGSYSMQSAKIHPLLADSSNQRLLKEWLSEQETYRIADEERSLSDSNFDLCIVDKPALQAHREELERIKSNAEPIIVPVLLLLPERRTDVIEIDRGELADNVFPATVDEIVSLPIRQVELEWRIKALLRLRGQSLESHARASELRIFRQAIDDSGHAVVITETDGTIRYVNDAFTDLTGYERSEVIGRNPRILNSRQMPDEHFDRLWNTILAGDIWEEEIVNRKKSGKLYHAHQTIAPVYDDDDEITAFVSIQMDISERKETEQTLERYRTIIERLEDPVMLQDRDGNFELLNDAVLDFAGLSMDELLGNDEYCFMNDEAASAIDEKKTEVLETEDSVSYEITPTFEETAKEASFSTKRYPFYDSNDELAGTFAICRDVTALKEREEELTQYERAIVGATDLIAACDRTGRYLFANPQYRAYHDIETDDVTELTLEDVLDEEEYTEVRRNVMRALQGETVRYQMTRRHPTQGERTLNVHYYPLENGEDVMGVVAVLRDVTDREDRTRQLRVVDRVLRHNLRNDLNVVRLHVEQIQNRMARFEDDTDEFEQVADEFERAAEEILTNVNGLLTTSEKSRKITQLLSGTPSLQPVDVAEIVRTVSRSLSDHYPDAQITVSGPDSAVAFATSQLNEALIELVTNAIVHNDTADPHVRLQFEKTDEMIHLHVVDDGPGISKMDRDVLTEGRETDALYHGSGLGLWLVYWIVCRAGGSIDVSTVEPRGTRVTVTVPRCKRDELTEDEE